jgi:hypothetical protein
MHKALLTLGFICCLYNISIAAEIPVPLTDGEGTEESRLTIAGTPTVQIKVYGGMRTLEGDNRPYELKLNYTYGGSDALTGDKFAATKGSGGLGFISETTIQLPLHFGLGFDLQFGTFLSLGGFVGGGYNLAVIKNLFWLQAKTDIQFTWAFISMGDVPVGRVNGTYMEDTKLDVSTFFITLRPEVNGYFRIMDDFLLMAGIGYQLPILSSGLSFDFSGKDYGGETVTETIKSSSSNVSLSLDGEKVDKVRIAPRGITFNVAIVLEIY